MSKYVRIWIWVFLAPNPSFLNTDCTAPILLQSELCLWNPSFLTVDLMWIQETPGSFVSPLGPCSFTLGSSWVWEIMWKSGCPEISTTGNNTLLQKLRWLYTLGNESNSQETYGALDLGGASTQITFVPRNQTIESPENALYFRLYGKDYNVYTHSFLCYGKDQALLKKLIKDSQASITESRPDFSTSGLPAPTSCCFLFYFSDWSEVGYCTFQTFLSTSGRPVRIIPSRHHPPVFVYCTISKDTTQNLSWEIISQPCEVDNKNYTLGHCSRGGCEQFITSFPLLKSLFLTNCRKQGC